MLILEIAEELGIHKNKANYYREVLKRHRLLDPKRRGNSLDYTEEDVHHFRTLHQYIAQENLTAGEAIRYIREGVTPAQALDKIRQLNRQLEAAQSKIVELRKPSVFERFRSWLRSLSGSVFAFRKPHKQ